MTTVPILKKKEEIPGQMSIGDMDPEIQEQLEAMAAAHPPEPELPPIPVVTTAFLVVVSSDGQTMATGDLHHQVIQSRLPSADDIYSACAVIQKDITTTESAMRTQQAMIQYGQQMQQQAQAQQLAAGLGDLRGGIRG